jgi:hypothetical protein
MTTMHVLFCKSGDKWSVYTGEHATIGWSLVHSGNALRQAVDASFAYGFSGALTYSERQADEVAADVAEEPEQLAGVDSALDLTILAPERRWPTDDRWQTILRDGRRFWSPGSGFIGFRQQVPFESVLKEQVLSGFFGFNNPNEPNYWRTFMPAQKGVSRPHRPRELYLRPAWNARELAPQSFGEFRPGPVVTPEMAAKRLAKMPQNKSAARRLKHQQNAERFKAEAEERARQRGEVA